ncbi:MAG: DUF6737 family protein [Cyanobium sp.]
MTNTNNIWVLKPWWCQPWSILATGVVLPVASWLLLKHWWVTAPLAGVVIVWWWLFLVVVPSAYRVDAGVGTKNNFN